MMGKQFLIKKESKVIQEPCMVCYTTLSLAYCYTGGGPQTMPFTLAALVPLSLTLKEVCLGLVELAFPDSRPSIRDDYRTAVHGADLHGSSSAQETQMWSHLFKVGNLCLDHLESEPV